MSQSSILAADLWLNDRYRVVCPLGGGGFSQVYEVQDGDTHKVLKVLNLSAFQQPKIRQKAIALFRREADFLSRFRHPGVPRVESDGYFVLELIDGLPLHCLVMEKVVGLDLQQWRREQAQPLAQAQAIAWLRQLIEILLPLHQQQFFHRDIKPANIMLRSDGQLVLIDFGAVREITETYLKRQRGQETGTAIISAGYTPPEQAEGQAVPQSDFFALGRTLVDLLTGEDPMNLPKSSQTGQLIWHNRAPEVSPLLIDLIDQLMAPFPGQRPQTCEEIGDRLNQIERVLAQKRWLPLRWIRRQRSLKDWRQLRAMLLKGGLAAGLVLTGNLWLGREGISTMLNDQGVTAYEVGDHDTASWYYQSALLFDPGNSSAHFNLGDLYETRQQFEQAYAEYQQALQEGQLKAYNNLARLEIQNNRNDRAVILLKSGLPKAVEPELRYAMLKNLGWAELNLKQYDEAQQNLEASIALNSKQAAAHCLMAQVLMVQPNIKTSTVAAEWRLCIQYANPQKNLDEKLWVEMAQRFLASVKGAS